LNGALAAVSNEKPVPANPSKNFTISTFAGDAPGWFKWC
jgi:hypothetical protein